jgi:hypothetical protein
MRHVVRQLICAATAGALFWSTGASAREWYEKSCTKYGVDQAKNWYVGGPGNKSHLHIGSDFVSVYSSNYNGKVEQGGVFNASNLNTAYSSAPDGGYTSLTDVQTCLQAACTANGYNWSATGPNYCTK